VEDSRQNNDVLTILIPSACRDRDGGGPARTKYSKTRPLPWEITRSAWKAALLGMTS